ncbi:GTP:AMP phosphotransferase mitochondrial [Spathaspora sp. JA1]|nr:GTP:AMP phosphotransferase mitochondrial [Spathaspora sp. JA1]
MTSLVRPLRILLLGAPGSGKGTQTTRLLKRFPNVQSLSTGDVLRSQIVANTKIGMEASEYIKRGVLIPDSTMVGLVISQLERQKWLDPKSSWLLDGFPRTYKQAIALDHLLDEHDCTLNMVVELDVDQKVILERIEARWVHIPSGRVYNIDYNPPKVPFKDDITGEPLTKRPDDTAEVFEKRLIEYNKEIEPIKRFYANKHVLHKVTGNTSDIIYPKLESLVLEKFA